MTAPFSTYLTGIAPGLSRLIGILAERFSYVSVLATDSVGFSLRASQRGTVANGDTLMTERGIVVRVCREGAYAEYALNTFDPEAAESCASEIVAALEEGLALAQSTGISPYETPKLPDAPLTGRWEMECAELPEETDIGRLMEDLLRYSEEGAGGEGVVDCTLSAQSTHVSKLFLSPCRDLRQSYVISEGSVRVLARKERTEMAYSALASRQGPEIFNAFPEKVQEALLAVRDLLSAEHIVPGEYDIITAPEVSGLIAHEAFGHGVEMDMFVKGRALGAQYLGKRVGSPLVSMHDGALCEVNVASYAFDDEGNLAGDALEIQSGILQTGICDALSALRLGTVPTGNGKRENYAHKVYTRMTNTMFDSGESTLEEMIASVKYGYLLKGMQSGMEDPKHWGIQCIIDRGYEIRDGKLTGRIVSPVIMTGYVPDLLGSVSMVSSDRECFGGGACGKGHKEWVKVSDGGPYMKARARLG